MDESNNMLVSAVTESSGNSESSVPDLPAAHWSIIDREKSGSSAKLSLKILASVDWTRFTNSGFGMKLWSKNIAVFDSILPFNGVEKKYRTELYYWYKIIFVVTILILKITFIHQCVLNGSSPCFQMPLMFPFLKKKFIISFFLNYAPNVSKKIVFVWLDPDFLDLIKMDLKNEN